MNIQEEIKRAAAGWPLSLRDDPTAFGPEDTWASVTDKINSAASENVRSTISRALGRAVEDVTMACDSEIEESGDLADLNAVMCRFFPGLEIDPTPVHAATGWDARIAAVRQVFAAAVSNLSVPTVDENNVHAFIAGDPRLAHLIAETAQESDGWDDEEPTTATPAPAMTAKGDAHSPGDTAELMALVGELGIKDAELAATLGVSRGYLSLMRKGERQWLELNPERAGALTAVIDNKVQNALRALAIIRARSATND